MGKRIDEWEKARSIAKQKFEGLGITSCELKFVGCFGDNALGFAHRHKRQWYYSKPGRNKLLGKFNQILLACNYCHDKIENDAELTERMFEMKRSGIYSI